MALAVCITCGAEKSGAWRTCEKCGFDPRSSVPTLVKSVYLSIDRYEELDDRESYKNELDKIAELIRCRKAVAYDQAELSRLENQYYEVQSAQRHELWTAFQKTFLPGLRILLAILLAIFLLKLMKMFLL